MSDKMRERLILTKEQGRQLVWDDLEGFEQIQDKIQGKRRWEIDYYLVVRRESDGKYFGGRYSRGATENQDYNLFEFEDPDFKEVFPVKRTITIYE